MRTQRAYRGGRPRQQGSAEDPLVTVNLQVRQRQLAVLDQRADAAPASRAALGREAIDRLLTRRTRPWHRRTPGASEAWAVGACDGTAGPDHATSDDPWRPPARLEPVTGQSS